MSQPGSHLDAGHAGAIKINGVDSDSSQEAAIPATTLWQVEYVSSTIGWILFARDELGAVISEIVPD